MSSRGRPRYNAAASNQQPHRPAGNGNRRPLDNARPPMPPIAPSSQAKARLKSFQFIEGRPTAAVNRDDDNKENTLATADEAESKSKPASPRRPTGASQTEQLLKELAPQEADQCDDASDTQVPSRFTTCPITTPKTRLPIEDLVGNPEDAAGQLAKKHPSPEDHIYWERNQSPTVFRRKKSSAAGRKRTHSSSPAAGTPVEPSSEPTKDSAMAHNGYSAVRTPFKTPRPDPAADLWNNYATTRETPSTGKTAFAHLLIDSSPYSDATGSVGGLRRWVSCGDHWPTSGSKRRKFRHIEDPEHKENVFESPDRVFKAGQEDGTVSKVEQLLEQIQETFEESMDKAEERRPQLSQQIQTLNRHASSSTFTREDDPLQATPDVSSQKNTATKAEAELIPAGTNPSDTDYGCEFEGHMFDEAMGMDTGRDPDFSQPSDQRPVSVADIQSNNLPKAEPAPASLKPPLHEDDEFDDDEFGDDDMFCGDIDELCQKVESRAASLSGGPKLRNPVSVPTTDAGRQPTPVFEDKSAQYVNDSDEFGGSDICDDDLVAAEMYLTQSRQATTPVFNSVGATGKGAEDSTKGLARDTKAKTIKAYRVTQVIEGHYADAGGFKRPEKVLAVTDEETKKTKTITLREAWYNSACEIGSKVHVVGHFSGLAGCECTIDNNHNMLIINPDYLLSATVVADSLGCLRRAVLSDRVKATSSANAPQVYGHILHELFQEALKANRWDTKWLDMAIEAIIPHHFESLVEINLSVVQATEHLQSKLPELQGWANMFVKRFPSPNAKVQSRGDEKTVLSINKLLEVEEHVWAPSYGLKGNIDATVQTYMGDSTGEKTLTVPLELKTGRSAGNANHMAQTALYTLLLSNRYDINIAYGILYYLESSEMHRVSTSRREIVDLIIRRNEVASYSMDRTKLPPVLENSRICDKCFAQQPCFLYHKLLEDGAEDKVGPKDAFNELARYLGPSDQKFFKKWDTLITKEESESIKMKRELWTMLGSDRERVGRCFSGVIIESDLGLDSSDTAKINRYKYTLIRQAASKPFSETQITVGEPIVVSDEEGHFALANGFVTQISRDRVTVAVDRRLHNSRKRMPGFDAVKRQTFSGIMEVKADGTSVVPRVDGDEPTVYRIDKDEFSNGMATVRNNLIQIMDSNVYKSKDLRALIIDERAPTFRTPASHPKGFTQSSHMSMNTDQRAAVDKVMSAQDYALILGMPGTGKTTTIAHIIRALVAQGKSVLLTSYTHTAVDNILLKIRNDNIGILRLGSTSKVHPEVQQFATLGGEPKASLEELERTWRDSPIVATTCLGINHAIFRYRVFDYCIVDEASQITLPVCLGPIRMAKTFILVGDHYQLPPLVQNKEAVQGGLDVSLFKLLSERQPGAVVNLETQYRMCEDVMSLANKLIYSGRLKCGNDAVANRTLSIPSPLSTATCNQIVGLRSPSSSARSTAAFNDDNNYISAPGYHLKQILEPERRVIFLNTDSLGPDRAHESLSGQRIQSPIEAALIAQIATTLLYGGVSATDIGVVTFFRSQLALLKSTLRSLRPLRHHHTTSSTSNTTSSGSTTGSAADIELHTADRFQGRDKEVILVSCVRSNSTSTVGHLLRDWRRVNVALTRARSKLVVIGSAATLSAGDPEVLGGLVRTCREKGWLLDVMPQGVLGAEPASSSAMTKSPQSTPRTKLRPKQRQMKTPKKGMGDDTTTAALCSPLSASIADGENKENSAPRTSAADTIAGKARRRTPAKMGTVSRKALLGGKPVLRDVVNDAVGDDAVELGFEYYDEQF